MIPLMTPVVDVCGGLQARPRLAMQESTSLTARDSLVWLLLFNSTFSTNRLYHATEVQCISRRAGNNTTIQLNSETIEETKNIIHTLWPGLHGDDPLATVRLPQRSLSSQSLGK